MPNFIENDSSLEMLLHSGSNGYVDIFTETLMFNESPLPQLSDLLSCLIDQYNDYPDENMIPCINTLDNYIEANQEFTF